MFESARIKLTVWYMVIIAFVCLAFSAVIYRFLTLEVERFARMQIFRFQTVEQRVIDESKQRIFWSLMTINGVIVIVSGGLGYILAGRTLRPVADMLEEQKRFVGDASHELRTPLTSLKSAFEVFLRAKKPTAFEMNTLVAESIEEVDKLQALSDAMLKLARAEKTDPKTKKKEVNVQTTIELAIKKVAARLQEKQLEIVTEARSGLVWADPEQLVDLWVILLDNAIKYCTPAGQIRIKIQTNINTLTVSVADTGVGIAKTDLPKIFDRFFRSDMARNRTQAGGYGLGLSIAKKLVEGQNATITANSKVGKGSIFKVFFSLLK